ncbi:MAG: hypothetical protein F4X95_00490 [Oligoflexia bacterium]|nr:hypothetical protein [Oligoflexia bacterium]
MFYNIKFSAILTGILFSIAFTASKKAPAESEAPNKDIAKESITPYYPHPPRRHLIRKLLNQLHEVNRKLQAGVVVQCRCNNDWWWAYESSMQDSGNDQDSGSIQDSANDQDSAKKILQLDSPHIVRGYGYNKNEAEWDAVQACSPRPILAFKQGESENKGASSINEINENETETLIKDTLLWCRTSQNFLY